MNLTLKKMIGWLFSKEKEIENEVEKTNKYWISDSDKIMEYLRSNIINRKIHFNNKNPCRVKCEDLRKLKSCKELADELDKLYISYLHTDGKILTVIFDPKMIWDWPMIGGVFCTRSVDFLFFDSREKINWSVEFDENIRKQIEFFKQLGRNECESYDVLLPIFRTSENQKIDINFSLSLEFIDYDKLLDKFQDYQQEKVFYREIVKSPIPMATYLLVIEDFEFYYNITSSSNHNLTKIFKLKCILKDLTIKDENNDEWTAF